MTPPSTPGQYTLRLDLVHAYNGASTWEDRTGQATSKYSRRDERIQGFDSTRWTGSSVIERDEFTIAVTAGGGTAMRPALQSVATPDGGSLGINLATTNLHFEADTGLGFTDLGSPIGLTYGYNQSKRRQL